MTYNEAFPQSLSLGKGLIFGISLLNSIPWNGISLEDKNYLERAYWVRSGEKHIYSKFLELSDAEKMAAIVSMYSEKWTKYWNLFKLEYDPLSAYIVEETGNRNKNFDTSRTTTYGKIENVNSSDTGTVTDNGSNSNSSTDSVFGFNSVDSVPSDTSSGNEQNTNTETRNLTNTTNTSNSGTDDISGEDTEAEEYTVSKQGNIGYSTPQKLLSGEFELWKTPFFQMVFSDIDKFIMLKIYN